MQALLFFKYFLKKIPTFFCFFSLKMPIHSRNPNRGRGIRHWSGFMSTKMISGPIFLIHSQGIRKSSRWPSWGKRQGAGTTRERIFPSGISTTASDTNPSRRPSLIQITSLQCNSVNLQAIKLPPQVILQNHMPWGGRICLNWEVPAYA